MREGSTCCADAADSPRDVDFSGAWNVGNLYVIGVHLACEFVADLETLGNEALLGLHKKL